MQKETSRKQIEKNLIGVEKKGQIYSKFFKIMWYPQCIEITDKTNKLTKPKIRMTD